MGGVGLAYNSAIFDKEIYPKLFSSGVSLFSVETWKDFFSNVVYVYLSLSIYLIKGRFVHVALFVSKVMHKLSLEIEIDQEISKRDFGTFLPTSSWISCKVFFHQIKVKLA